MVFSHNIPSAFSDYLHSCCLGCSRKGPCKNAEAGVWHCRWSVFRFFFYMFVCMEIAKYSRFLLSDPTRISVGKFAILTFGPVHTSIIIGIGVLTSIWCFLRFGKHRPIAAIVTALCFATLYFGSSNMLYQHHYLLILILGILAVFGDSPASLRCIAITFSLVFFWMGIAKLNRPFLEGKQLATLWKHHGLYTLVENFGKNLKVSPESLWSVAAHATFFLEICMAPWLCIALYMGNWGKSRALGTTVAFFFHGAFFTEPGENFSIGFFAVYCIILHLFVQGPHFIYKWPHSIYRGFLLWVAGNDDASNHGGVTQAWSEAIKTVSDKGNNEGLELLLANAPWNKTKPEGKRSFEAETETQHDKKPPKQHKNKSRTRFVSFSLEKKSLPFSRRIP